MIQLDEQHAIQDIEQCVNKTLLTYVDYLIIRADSYRLLH